MPSKNAKAPETDKVETDKVPDEIPAANVTFPDGSDATNAPITLETYKAKARVHGQSKAIGDDSVAMLALDICEGSRLKAIDPRTTTDKTKANEADTTDDIEGIFTEYVTARGLKAVHERKGNSMKNKVSQLRKFAHLGALTEVNGPEILDDVKARYKVTYNNAKEEIRADMNDAFTAYYQAAMAQVDSPKKAIDETTIEKCLFKAKKTVNRNVSTEWNKIANAAKSLTDGTRKLKDGSVIEDKSEKGMKLAADIVAYAKNLSDLIEAAELEAKAAALKADFAARNGVIPEGERETA